MRRLRIIKHDIERWIYNTNTFTFLLWAALVAHVIYAAMFLFVRQYILFVVSAVQIVYFISIMGKKDKNGKGALVQMVGMAFCVYVGLVLSTLLIGKDCYFNMVLLSLIPVSFFLEYLVRNSSTLSYILSTIIFITNIAFIFINDKYVSGNILNNTEKNIFQCFNTAVAIFLTVFSAIVFMAEVFNISSGLTRQNKKLNELANYDPLTRLLLRRPMLENIDKCVEQKKLYAKEYVICIGDIDFFKKFNDTYGHECGDVVLKTVSKVISDGVGSNNYVCRWGGEEILILIPDSTIYDSQKLIEEVRKKIEGTVINYKNTNVHVTMTFGISSSEKHIMSHDVIVAADKALYTGKESGRNRVCCG